MTPAVEQLVRETMELTGADTPQLLEDDAPVLSDEALAVAAGDGGGAGDDGGFYLTGIIGGKDVGKSALVNALVGRNITAITSHGPGTETVVAYAHASRAAALKELLEREVPGQYRVVTHEEPHLLRQVLLDLPDIDSHYKNHLEVTRAMLRHMLYPVWVQSVEKYADRQPQEMLARVAAGNAAQNFVFCLNKVDQLEGTSAEGRGPSGERNNGGGGASTRPSALGPRSSGAAEEIRDDFAGRIARTLGLNERPDVFLICAVRPERYELPRLREVLSRQKSEQAVRESKALAVRRQDRTLIQWLAEQRLDERAARLARLEQEAEELLAARVGGPLLEEAIPRLLDDPANRLALTDEVLRERVARWPLVNLVHTLLSPLLAVWRSNVGAAARGGGGPRGGEALVEAYLDGAGGGGGSANGRGMAGLVQATFAQLRQAQPTVATLYRHNHLWEDMPADMAAGELRRTLAATVERQRAAAVQRLAGRGGVVAPVFRWLLTVGALLWFPFVQPVLQGMLSLPDLGRDLWSDGRKVAALVVGLLSGAALLRNVTFLIIWFTVIWLWLRWGTQRRVGRLLSRWKSPDARDEALNLNAQAMRWMADLLAPVRRVRERTEDVARRAMALGGPTGADLRPEMPAKVGAGVGAAG